MRHTSLVSFLNGDLQPERLWQEIAEEVGECLAARAKGDSGHVIIITDGPVTCVSRENGAILVAALAAAKLALQVAAYVADALIMSDDIQWEDEAVAEALFFVSDESTPLTLAEVEKARSRLVRTH